MIGGAAESEENPFEAIFDPLTNSPRQTRVPPIDR
jgi:hypothetical protein